MCGIGGILRVWRAGEPPPPLHESIPEGWLNILDDSIRHRGPDGQGRFRQRVVRPDGATVDVALVHRRLSIIDHAGGAQPMVLGRGGDFTTEAQRAQSGIGGGAAARGRQPDGQEDGRQREEARLWLAGPAAPAPDGPWAYRGAPVHVCPKCGPETLAVVFNGCIYNHRELRRELQGLGHEFHSDHSDTEVLLHGWREWGRDLPSKLDGMFAIAAWSACTGELVLARDLAGEKPLYVRPRGAHSAPLVFSSAVPGLLRLLSLREPQTQLADASFALSWIHAGSASGLPVCAMNARPGSQVVTSPDGPTLFSVFARDTVCPRRDQQLDAESLDRLIEGSVMARLDADVRVATFLSGGIDSSLVALHAARANSGLTALTVRMPSVAYDESDVAARVAVLIGVRHEVLDCAAQPATDLAPLIHQLGLPFGDSSLLPSAWVCRAAGATCRVALGGDGADELLFGYERDAHAGKVTAASIPLSLLPSAIWPSRDPKSRGAKLRRTSRLLRHGGGLAAIFDATQTRRLARKGWRNAVEQVRLGIRGGELDRTFDSYLPNDILRKTDTASMAVGLEVRSPFLSRDLIKACLSAPLSNLMPGGQRKGLLRQVARKYFPAEIVDRPKQGFAIPIGDWFRSDYGGMRQLLYDHLEGPDPFPGLPLDINMKFVKRMLREHDAAGEKSLNPWHGRDHSQRLYMLLVLSIWAKWLARLPGPGAP